jgi:hypothetical protein
VFQRRKFGFRRTTYDERVESLHANGSRAFSAFSPGATWELECLVPYVMQLRSWLATPTFKSVEAVNHILQPLRTLPPLKRGQCSAAIHRSRREIEGDDRLAGALYCQIITACGMRSITRALQTVVKHAETDEQKRAAIMVPELIDRLLLFTPPESRDIDRAQSIYLKALIAERVYGQQVDKAIAALREVIDLLDTFDVSEHNALRVFAIEQRDAFLDVAGQPSARRY